MKMDARTDVYFEKLRFIGHWYGNTHVNHFQGIARTQSPTNKNYAPESPTFGVIAGVKPNRSAMERPRPGGTAFVITISSVPGKYDFSGATLIPSQNRLNIELVSFTLHRRLGRIA